MALQATCLHGNSSKYSKILTEIELSCQFTNLFIYYNHDNTLSVHCLSACINDDTGFPLFRTDKIPYFQVFKVNFREIFFIIFKVWFPSGFEYKYANLLSFIWTKN